MKSNTNNCTAWLILSIPILSLNSSLSSALAQGTALTYQGRLSDGGQPADGLYDLSFAVYDASSNGTPIAKLPTGLATPVSNGLFTVLLDFGPGVFTGSPLWLEIGVRTNGSAAAYTTLAPRQGLTPTPYSITAANLSGTLPLAQLPAGVLLNNQSGVTLNGTFGGTLTGNGAGVTNVPIAGVSSAGAITWGNFVLASMPSVGLQPTSVTAGDINGDGRVDLIAASPYANALNVLINNGGGAFAPSPSPQVGQRPLAVITADMNGDGKLDLVSANADNTLTVLTNNGSGAFAVASSPSVGSYPTALVAADVTGDGLMDLICANANDNTLSVLWNKGTFGFVLGQLLPVGHQPVSVTAADVNGDGRMDLICANFIDSTVTVLLNTGGGLFTPASSPAVGTSPRWVIAVDVNGDGWPDLITANSGTNTLTVLTNDNHGGFVLSSSLGVGAQPYAVAAVDVNGDGRVDLISANSGDNTLTVLTNDGRGGFALAATLATGDAPQALVAADVNGDGKADLVCGNYGNSTLSIFFNLPTFAGTFAGNGAGLSDVNAANLTGTVADTRLSSNVALLNANQNFSGVLTMSNPSNVVSGAFAGDGSGLTNVAFTWQVVAGTNQQAQPGVGYLVTNASVLTTITLPVAPPVGSVFRVGGSATWLLVQNPGQSILTGPLGGAATGLLWTANSPVGYWQSVASSTNGIRLYAAAGSISTGGGPIYASPDAGFTWAALPDLPWRIWTSVACSADGTRVIVAGNPSELYLSTNSGAAFRVVPANAETWSSLASSADGTKLFAASGSALVMSVDSGAHWFTNGVMGGHLACSTDATKLVAVSGGIYTSSDSGTNWVFRKGGSWSAVASSADGTKLVAALAYGQIWISSDSGTNWTATATSQEWRSVACSADRTKLVAGSSIGQIWTSNNSAADWVAGPTIGNQGVDAVASSAGGEFLAASYDGQIYTSKATVSTTPGSAAYLTGGPGASIELLYLGGNQFLIASYVPPIAAY